MARELSSLEGFQLFPNSVSILAKIHFAYNPAKLKILKLVKLFAQTIPFPFELTFVIFGNN